MRKVLIMVYYWPPAGGGGVQRWLKISSYLKQFGWEPIIYTAKNADYPLIDTSLQKDIDPAITVLRQPIFEIRKLYKRFATKNKQATKSSADEIFYIPKDERSWKQNVSIWLRGNVFVPDARVTWVKPSVRFLKNYLSKQPVDAIISSGPPHSMHLIAMQIKRSMQIPWIADFRDPWTQIEYYEKLMLSKSADKRHRRLEKAVLQTADTIVNVAPHWNTYAESLGAKRTELITNGFDEKDFTHDPPELEKNFHLLHAGTLANDRNPQILWDVLKELSNEIPEFKSKLRVEVIGKTSANVLQSAQKAGLAQQIMTNGYVDHKTAIQKMQSAQILLLLINKAKQNALGRIPGKIFEYLAAKRPILLIGPETGDAANIIHQTNSGVVVDFEDHTKLKEIILKYYDDFKHNQLRVESQKITAYSRAATAKQYADLLSATLNLD